MTDPADRRIVFQISEGIKARVAEIEFRGNEVFSDRTLRGVMKEVKEHALVSWVRKKNLFIPSKMDEDLERLKNYYQDHGYMDVTFGEPQLETIRRNRVRVTVPIKEGEIHKFGKVTVSGNELFTTEQIIGDWPLSEGETIRRQPIQTRADAFGDAADAALLDSLPLLGTHWVAITLPDADDALALVDALRHHRFCGRIALAARDEADLRRLNRARPDMLLRPFEDAADQAARLISAEA